MFVETPHLINGFPFVPRGNSDSMIYHVCRQGDSNGGSQLLQQVVFDSISVSTLIVIARSVLIILDEIPSELHVELRIPPLVHSLCQERKRFANQNTLAHSLTETPEVAAIYATIPGATPSGRFVCKLFHFCFEQKKKEVCAG